jgi:hypothetical protein
MGAGPFSSDSHSTVRQPQVTGQPTASGGSNAQQIQLGGRARSVGQGSISLEPGASVGGFTLGQSHNRDVTITTNTTDNGALAMAADLIQKTVTSQADTTTAALGSLGKLSETRETGGGNVIADVATKGFAALAFAVVASLAIFLILRRKG